MSVGEGIVSCYHWRYHELATTCMFSVVPGDSSAAELDTPLLPYCSDNFVLVFRTFMDHGDRLASLLALGTKLDFPCSFCCAFTSVERVGILATTTLVFLKTRFSIYQSSQ